MYSTMGCNVALRSGWKRPSAFASGLLPTHDGPDKMTRRPVPSVLSMICVSARCSDNQLKSVTRSVALYSRTVASRSLPATLGTGKQRPTANRPGPAITMGSSAAIASRWYSKPSPA